MFTRFRSNVSRYPRLFVTVMVALPLTLAVTYGSARLIGIEAVLAGKLVAALVVVSMAADAALYSWIFGNFSRRAILLDMLDRFEGRTPVVEQEEEEEEEEQDEWEEEPESEEWQEEEPEETEEEL